jgi:uncharacterized C2H2 Zn-finger protein
MLMKMTIKLCPKCKKDFMIKIANKPNILSCPRCGEIKHEIKRDIKHYINLANTDKGNIYRIHKAIR